MKKILFGIGAIAALVVAGLSFERIPAGYVGVVYSPNGGVKEQVLSQGWHFVNPLYSVTEYTVATEQAYLSKDSKEGSRDDDSFYVPTSDGKVVNVDLEFSYRFDADNAHKIFSRHRGKTGKEIENSFMRGKVKTWTGEVTSQYNVLDIYGSRRGEINSAIFNHIKKNLEEYHIVLESATLSRIAPDNDTAKAIQARVNAQQNLETQKIEREKAKIDAEKLAIVEEGKRRVKLIQAKAESESITIKAEAQAQANKKLSESLTPDLVEYEKLKVWNGVLPQVTGGSVPMINLK